MADVTVGHTHDVTIPVHVHEIKYGIFEEDHVSVQIKINGVVITGGVSLSDGGSLDMDISSYVGIPGETYKLEVTLSRNGTFRY